METLLKTDKKLRGNAQKFVHKLNKQQTELWCHLVNLSELCKQTNLMQTKLKKEENFEGKHKNSSTNSANKIRKRYWNKLEASHFGMHSR